tara:strand:+ start:1360 stop:1593 length:234 start_codon:yes stop_codon:yes gene_type:complete
VKKVLYEYIHGRPRKRGCPKTFEIIRSIAKRDEPAPCPKCGETKSERIRFQSFSINGNSEPDLVAGDTEMEDFDDFD